MQDKVSKRQELIKHFQHYLVRSTGDLWCRIDNNKKDVGDCDT